MGEPEKTPVESRRGVPTEETPTELLMRAVGALEPAERDQVLVWILDRVPAIQTAGMVAELRQLVVGQFPEAGFGERPPALSARHLSLRGGHQAIPVRLPSAQHALLRQWCQDHGFAMATVIRGLLDRFLEDQGLSPDTEPVTAEPGTAGPDTGPGIAGPGSTSSGREGAEGEEDSAGP